MWLYLAVIGLASRLQSESPMPLILETTEFFLSIAFDIGDALRRRYRYRYRPYFSRVGAVALYTVLWTVVAKYRNGHFQHLAPLNWSNQKLEQMITSAGPPTRPKFIMIGRGVAAPLIGEVYGWRSSFFSRRLLGQAHSRPRALESDILYINRCGFGQGCAFWGSLRYISSNGGVIPQNPSF
jgi:hypothetical protein